MKTFSLQSFALGILLIALLVASFVLGRCTAPDHDHHRGAQHHVDVHGPWQGMPAPGAHADPAPGVQHGRPGHDFKRVRPDLGARPGLLMPAPAPDAREPGAPGMRDYLPGDPAPEPAPGR